MKTYGIEPVCTSITITLLWKLDSAISIQIDQGTSRANDDIDLDFRTTASPGDGT